MGYASWQSARINSPVNVSDSSFYTDAEVLESRLNRLDTSESDRAFTDLIEYNVTLDGIIGDVLSAIYSAKDQVEEHEDVADVMYKLIELNLTSYRFRRIESIIEDNSGRRSGPSGGQAVNVATVKILQANMRRLLNVIKKALNDANKGFMERDGVSNSIVYVGLLAKSMESRLRQYTDFDAGGVDDILGMVEDVDDDEDLNEQLEEIEDIDETMKEVEEDLANVG